MKRRAHATDRGRQLPVHIHFTSCRTLRDQQRAIKARAILHTETKPWRDRVPEARELLAELGDTAPTTFAANVRRALAEDNRRVHAHLAGLRDLELSGTAGASGFEQWRAWSSLQGLNAQEIPAAFELPPVGPARSSIVSDPDPRSRYRAFEASTMMALRQGPIAEAAARREGWMTTTGRKSSSSRSAGEPYLF